MQFSTPVNFLESPIKYSYENKIVLLGSCFSDEVGQRLIKNKFDALANPFGTIFNPISIADLFLQNDFNPEMIVQQEDLFFHYRYHSSVFGNSEEDVKTKIESLHNQFKQNIETTDLLILTLGTAFVHELIHSKIIVSNCHKQNRNLFQKRLLSIEEIVKPIQSIIEKLSPKTQLMLTLSPVRHTKEGMAENQLSKSTLRVACNEICKQNKRVTYLPSYEKMIDDLRDYRYYKSDLIHPTEQAVDIIFEDFCSAYFDANTLETLEEVKKINAQIQHKSLYGNHLGHIKFQNQLLQKLEKLNEKLDFSYEINLLKMERSL